MKKLISLIAVMLLFSAASFAQSSIEDIYNEFADKPGVESVHIGRFLMKIGKMIVRNDCDENERRLIGEVKSLYVLDLSDSPVSVRNKFRKAADGIRPADVELLLEACEDSENVRIYMKRDRKYIRKLYILDSGDEPSMVCINGKIRKDDIGRIVSENTGRRCEKKRNNKTQLAEK
ncbi:MAG: DUF4252 domain-containing protein [Bacteroidales bacterium]|nr:DUF4252 domain-containing protein [Bacteroidales bacterium]